MRKETEKKIEKNKVRERKTKSSLLSSENRKDNIKRRVKSKRLRNGKQLEKRNTTELFLRSNNLKNLPFVIDSLDVNISAEDIIRDIYPMIQDDISFFISPNITSETPPIEFLRWMMQCYTDIYGEWEITKDGNKYQLKRLIAYDIDAVGYSVETEFLGRVEDIEMFNLLITSLSLMRSVGVPFWDGTYAVEMAQEMIDMDIEELESMDDKDVDKEEFEGLKKGKKELIVMEGLINRIIADKVTFEDFIISKNELIEKKELDKSIVDLFNCLEKFLKIDDNILNYSCFYDSDLDDGHPVMPHEYAHIAYSLDDNSAIGYRLNQSSSDSYNNYGALPFSCEVINEVEDIVSDYPHKYIELLNLFVKVEQYYYNLKLKTC